MDSLEVRVGRLEDIEAIKNLKMLYARLCDAGYDADGLAALYTPDAVVDAGAGGILTGQDAIRGAFSGASSIFTFAIHYMIAHNVELEASGNIARGFSYLFQPATVQGRAVWLGGTYQDEYRKSNGKWLIHRQQLQLSFFTPYDEGWEKTPFVAWNATDA